jgi:hypothetical protein
VDVDANVETDVMPGWEDKMERYLRNRLQIAAPWKKERIGAAVCSNTA